jgi:hypothetical protein
MPLECCCSKGEHSLVATSSMLDQAKTSTTDAKSWCTDILGCGLPDLRLGRISSEARRQIHWAGVIIRPGIALDVTRSVGYL